MIVAMMMIIFYYYDDTDYDNVQDGEDGLVIYIFRFFHNAYFQNKRVDQNGTSKVVEQSKMKEMNKFKEEEEKKEKIQRISK